MLTSPLNIGLTYGLDPINASWFQVWFQGPTGQMPEVQTVHVANLPELGDNIQVMDAVSVNRSVRIPGGFSPNGSASIGFRMLTDQRCLNFWKSWYDLCYDRRQDSVPIATDVMGQGVVTIYNNLGPIREIQLLDVWPSSVKIGSLTPDTDEIMNWNLTLEVNEVNF